jgi:hypothetical protein
MTTAALVSAQGPIGEANGNILDWITLSATALPLSTADYRTYQPPRTLYL